jgi:hypothetical protein
MLLQWLWLCVSIVNGIWLDPTQQIKIDSFYTATYQLFLFEYQLFLFELQNYGDIILRDEI